MAIAMPHMSPPESPRKHQDLENKRRSLWLTIRLQPLV
jgi:hypothetical protein